MQRVGARGRGGRRWRALFLAAPLGVLACAPGCGGSDEEAAREAPPPGVRVAPVVRRPVTPTRTFNGRIEALHQVELRARVEGFVEERLFEEGEEVAVGDLLIRLEAEPYEARIAQIQGEITAAEGSLALARVELERQSALEAQDAASQQRLDEAKANYTQARGQLQRLRASLESARIDRGYTQIRAPIEGRVGRFLYSVGSFVGPGSGALARIVSQDPMYVTFPLSSEELVELRRTARRLGADPRNVTVRVRLPDGSMYDHSGVIDFVDVQVDPSTDTVDVRAQIPNPTDDSGRRLLVDGQLVGVVVAQAEPEQALLIPQAAVAVDQRGSYVLVVDAESVARRRSVELGEPKGTRVVVTSGLEEGERVVVEGLQKVRPDQRVQIGEAGEPGGSTGSPGRSPEGAAPGEGGGDRGRGEAAPP